MLGFSGTNLRGLDPLGLWPFYWVVAGGFATWAGFLGFPAAAGGLMAFGAWVLDFPVGFGAILGFPAIELFFPPTFMGVSRSRLDLFPLAKCSAWMAKCCSVRWADVY